MSSKYPNLNLKREQVEKLIDLYENTAKVKTEGTNSIQTICVTCPGMNCGECSGATIEGGDDPNGGNDPGADYGAAGGGRCRNKPEYDRCVSVKSFIYGLAVSAWTFALVESGGLITPSYIYSLNVLTATLLIEISECNRQYC